MVHLGPHVFAECQQMVLAVGGEYLDGDGLKKVASLVHLFDVVVSELVDLSFGA